MVDNSISKWISGFEGVGDIYDDSYSMHTFEEIIEWIDSQKKSHNVMIQRIALEECNPWYYDNCSGIIRNKDGSFFQIGGINAEYPNGDIVEQPIIIQKEIGYLGIVCKKINGVWHFLMQAKIEPGNINYVQISPTIQATKSNFLRKHGGKAPQYLDLFFNMKKDDILVDQIQSEQSSRFLGKRNRNVIIKVEDDIEELPSFRFLTLRQIKECMKYDNLVNMDTRTVLGCIPYVFMIENVKGYSDHFVNSMRKISHNDIIELYLRINNYKMFNSPKTKLVPLMSLKDWRFVDDSFEHKDSYPFKIDFCNIYIEGREVTKWNQPLFASLGAATFGLICCINSGSIEILVQIMPEIGCFDSVELGPSVQEEFGCLHNRDSVSNYFFNLLSSGNGIILDVILSEEGGRFYHEQNRNVIICVDKENVVFDKNKYVWVSLGTLNALTQLNNCLNIQLRNLLMLLSMYSA